MIRCRLCSEDKLETEFSFKNKPKATRHTLCKSCNRTYCAGHYQENAEKYKKRAVANSIARREPMHLKLFVYLSQHPCVDCDETDPIVLELDHRESAEKLHNLSRMWYNGYSWKKIEQEIAKCDVRCANCHRRRTARQQGWSNLVLQDMIGRLSSVGRALD